MRISGLAPSCSVGSSITVEKTLASVLESTPVHGGGPSKCGDVGEVKLRVPEVSKRFLTPSKSKKNASLRAPAKNEMSPAVTTLGVGPNDTCAAEMIFSP